MNKQPAVQPMVIFGLEIHQAACFTPAFEFLDPRAPLSGYMNLDIAKYIGGCVRCTKRVVIASLRGQVGDAFLVQELGQDLRRWIVVGTIGRCFLNRGA